MPGAVISETSTGRSLLLGEEDARKKERIIMEEGDEPEFDPSKYRPRHHERAGIRINDRELENLKKLYSHVVVHDFGDMYHLTDEERQQVNDSYKLFTVIRQVRTKYRKLNEFVKAYRKVLYVVKEIAKTNGAMDPDVFVEKVISGKIRIYGVRFPRLIMPKRQRRELNWDTISEYILNEELDPLELVRPANPKQDWTTVPEDPEKEMQHYFGMSYQKYVKDIQYDTSKIIDPEDFEAVSGENVMVPMSRLELLKLIRNNKEFGSKLKETVLKFRKFSEMERRLRGDDSYSSTVFDVTYDDINTIRDMDEERNLLKRVKKPTYEFNGHFLDGNAVDRFLFEADERLDNKTKVRLPASSQTMTVAEFKEELLREELEKLGYNIRKLYGIEEEEKAVKKKVEKEAKRLKRIKKMLTESDKRQHKKTKLVGFNVKRIEECVNSDKKKKSKKQKKKDKKHKKEIDQITLMQSAFEDFKEYEESMLNFDD